MLRDSEGLAGNIFVEELDRFGSSILESDDERVKLYRERILFEERLFDQEIKE